MPTEWICVLLLNARVRMPVQLGPFSVVEVQVRIEFPVAAIGLQSASEECERLLLGFRDAPSVYSAMNELIGHLAARRGTESWRATVEAMREHELGRLLRNDPMVRRCQWRTPAQKPFAITEAFVREWDDAAESLLEAEAPGQLVNAALSAGPLASAVRERRDGVRAFVLNAVRSGFRPEILGLGTGRSAEADLFAAGDEGRIAGWTVTEDEAGEDSGLRRRGLNLPRRVAARPKDFLAGTDARFDLIYTVDALDDLGEGAAVELLTAALARLKPNGRLLVSSFAPSLRETAYMEAVLDWRPALRDERSLAGLLGMLALPASASWTVWSGASGGVTFGLVETKAWAE